MASRIAALDAVLSRDLELLAHSGDPRWGIPPRATVEATTPQSFRKLWEPLLASGPIEVDIFGDMDSEATIKAVAETLGALPAGPTTYYVHDLKLDEALRGQGQGRAVVPLLLQAARSLGLSHLSLVAVNRRGPFWQAAGFARTAGAALQAAAQAKYGAGAVHMERAL